MADAPQTIKLDPKDPNYVEQIKQLQAMASQPLAKVVTTQKAVEAPTPKAVDGPTWLKLVEDLLPLVQQVLLAILDHQKQQTDEAKKQTAKLADIAFDVRRQAQLQRRLHGLE